MADAKKRGEIQKCNICGNIVEVVHLGGGPLVCCGQSMELLVEKTLSDEGKEKHVPVVEKTEDGTLVKVGSVAHPMEEGHYIEWIEVVLDNDGKVCRRYLKPGDAPEAEFKTQTEIITARVYCNIHGLWKA